MTKFGAKKYALECPFCQSWMFQRKNYANKSKICECLNSVDCANNDQENKFDPKINQSIKF